MLRKGGGPIATPVNQLAKRDRMIDSEIKMILNRAILKRNFKFSIASVGDKLTAKAI